MGLAVDFEEELDVELAAELDVELDAALLTSLASATITLSTKFALPNQHIQPTTTEWQRAIPVVQKQV